jgi:hypothetical protein
MVAYREVRNMVQPNCPVGFELASERREWREPTLINYRARQFPTQEGMPVMEPTKTLANTR